MFLPGRFQLSNEPLDYQLTVHYNNYESYAPGLFLARMDYVVRNMASDYVCKTECVMYNLIQYYGEAKLRLFLQDVVQIKAA